VVVSDGGLAYTFTLRRVFRFSDGTPVSARGFAYAIRRLRNRDLASPGAAPAVGIARVTAGGRRLVIRLAWANPYWTHGSPGQLDGVDIRWNQDPNTVVGEVEAGRLDEVAGVPAAQRQSLADRYGVGNGRFRVRPSACIGYVALNGLNRLLRNNPQLRKAISFAVDRTAYAGSAGPFGATPRAYVLSRRWTSR